MQLIPELKGEKMSKQLVQIMLVIMLFVPATWAQQSPFAGTWKMNPSQSTFADTPRISQTGVLSQAGDELKNSSDITYRGGAKIHTEWSAKLDGKPYPLEGDAHYDTVLVTNIDEHTLMVVSQKGPQVSRSSQWVISPDGKRMTRTQKVLDAKVQEVNNVIVFDKQR
jgi:hypothetical protein